MPAPLNFSPRMMQAPAAAFYLGVSVTTLRNLELPRHTEGALRLYDRIDLDAYASSMPLENEGSDKCEDVDEVFG